MDVRMMQKWKNQSTATIRLAIKFIYLQSILYAFAIVDTSCFCFRSWKRFYFPRTIGSIRLFEVQFYEALTGYYIYACNPRHERLVVVDSQIWQFIEAEKMQFHGKFVVRIAFTNTGQQT